MKLIILLATPLGKKKQHMYILIGYLSEQDGPILPAWDCPLRPAQEKHYVGGLKNCNFWRMSVMELQKVVPQSIKTEKKNTANFQPSWPHTWSITYVYCKCCDVMRVISNL